MLGGMIYYVKSTLIDSIDDLSADSFLGGLDPEASYYFLGFAQPPTPGGGEG